MALNLRDAGMRLERNVLDGWRREDVIEHHVRLGESVFDVPLPQPKPVADVGARLEMDDDICEGRADWRRRWMKDGCPGGERRVDVEDRWQVLELNVEQADRFVSHVKVDRGDGRNRISYKADAVEGEYRLVSQDRPKGGANVSACSQFRTG